MSDQSFFNELHVNKRKDQLLKARLDTLIKDRGFSNRKFYKELGISRQYWYLISWGLSECPLELKVKMSRILNTDSSLIFQIDKVPEGHNGCAGGS